MILQKWLMYAESNRDEKNRYFVRFILGGNNDNFF